MRPLARRLSGSLIGVLLGLACAPAAPPAAPPATPSPAAAAARAAGPAGGPPAAAPTASPAAAPLTAPATVRVGVLQLIAEAGVFIALERGYFAEEGIVPELTTLDTGARAIPALAAGQLDATAGGFSPSYVNAGLRGVEMKMVAAMGRNEPDASSGYVVVRKALVDTGAVRDWPDLRGRTIAVAARGSVNDYMVAKGLALGGVSDGEVTWVELTFPDQAAAFANGTVDAALSSEPLATLITERGLAVRWHAVADFLPGASTAFMSYAPAFMRDQPEAARRFMTAYLRGARDYNGAFRRGENRDDAVQILIKHTSVKDPSLYDRMGFPMIDPNGAINVPNVADQARWYGEQGLLQGTLEVTSLIDTSYLDAALARLGPYQP